MFIPESGSGSTILYEICHFSEQHWFSRKKLKVAGCAGAEEAGAEPHHAPEEVGGGAQHHRGEVREQEEEVPGEQRRVPGGAQETLCQGTYLLIVNSKIGLVSS